MEALDRYEDRGLPFVAFLFRVARNAAIDKSRRTRPDMSIDDLTHHPESGQNVEGEAMRAMEHQALVTAMSKLKADYREVLLLRFVEGYGAADVGKMTGRSEGAVRTLQHRVRDRALRRASRGGCALRRGRQRPRRFARARRDRRRSAPPQSGRAEGRPARAVAILEHRDLRALRLPDGGAGDDS